VAHSAEVDEFRQTFGDERADYKKHCGITIHQVTRTTGPNVSSVLTRQRIHGRTSPRPGHTIST
jgi:hypothetical protein